MNTPNSSTNQGPSETSDCIDAIVELTLDRMQRGDSIDLERINREHPELQPDLSARLKTLQHVLEMALDAGASDARTLLTSDRPKERTDRPTPPRSISVHCPHCGANVQVIQQHEEVTCRNCGSSIQLTPGDSKSDDMSTFAMQLGRLGRFMLLDVVGRGGFGVVYKALDTELGRTVAIKLPRRETFENENEERRFLREARHTARLNHANIVPVYEVGRDTDSPYIVSEFIDGMTLSELISHRRITAKESARLIATIANAVHYAHGKKIIHRDIKPGNILLNHDLEPFITDFGLARLDEAGEFTITAAGQVIGTPSYMSPEQVCADAANVGPLSDVYSLGVVFYRLLTGELPFRGSKRLMLHQIQYEEPRPPRSLNEYIPRDMETIALKAMAREPARRYQSAAALADDLARAIDDRPIKARPVSRTEKFWRLCRRYPVAAGLATALALLLLVTAVSGAVWAVRENTLRAAVETEKQRSIFEHARTLVYQGNRHVLEGDNIGSLPWLARAFEVEAENESRDATHRLRLGTLLDHCPRLVSLRIGDQSVTSTTVSPNEVRAAVGFRDGRVIVWDIRTDRTLIDDKGQSEVLDMVFSPDGNRLACSGKDGRVIVWNVERGEIAFRNHRRKQWVRQLGFDRPGERIVFGCGDNNAVVWDLESDRETVLAHRFRPQRVMWSREGQRIVTASWRVSGRQSTLSIWDLDKPGRPETGFTIPTTLEHLTIDTDNDRLIAADHEGQVHLWSLKPGDARRIKVFGPFGPLTHFQLLPSAGGKSLLLVHGDGRVRILRLNDGQVQKSLATGISVASASANASGNIVAISDRGNQVFVWNLDEGSMAAAPLWHRNSVNHLQLTESGNHLLSGGRDGLVKVWDLTPEKNALRVFTADGDHAHVAISRSGEHVAICHDREHRALVLVSLQDFRTTEIELPSPGGNMEFSPDNLELLVACEDGVARIYNTRTGQLADDRIRVGNQLDKVVWSRDGKLILGTDAADLHQNMTVLQHRFPGAIQLFAWERETAREVWRQPHDHFVIRVEISPDNRLVATWSHDKSCQVFALETGKEILRRKDDFDGYLTDIAFGSDSRSLLTACETSNLVARWDLRNGQAIGEPLQHFATPMRARFHPLTGQLVTATNDGTVHFWKGDNEDAEVVRTFGTRFQELTFNVRRRMFLTSTDLPLKIGASSHRNNGGVQLWDIETLQMVSPLFTSKSPQQSALFENEGKAIVAIGRDGTVTIWRISEDSRSSEVLKDLASVLCGHEVNEDARFVPLSSMELQRRWDRVKNQHPETSPSAYTSKSRQRRSR